MNFQMNLSLSTNHRVDTSGILLRCMMTSSDVSLHGSLWLTVDSLSVSVHDLSAAHLELHVTINGHSFHTARSKSTTHNVAHWNEHFLFPIDATSNSEVDFALFDVRSKPRRIGRYGCPLSDFVVSDLSAEFPTVRCKLALNDVDGAVGTLHCGVRWQTIQRHTIPRTAPQTAPTTTYPTTYSGATEAPSQPLLLPIRPPSPPPPYDEAVPVSIVSASALVNGQTPFRLRHCVSGLTAQPTTSPDATAVFLTLSAALSDGTALMWMDDVIIHVASHRALSPVTVSPTSLTPIVIDRERYDGDEEGAVAAAHLKFTIDGNRIVHSASGLALAVLRRDVSAYTDAVVVLDDSHDESTQWCCEMT